MVYYYRMEEFKERVIKERTELNEKRARLNEFIKSADGKYDDLPKFERIRLSQQLSAMNVYLDILDLRIKNNFE